MFIQPQRLRRFAVHVLLVWLFALGTGIANACIVQLHSQTGVPLVAHAHHHKIAAADPNADVRASQPTPCHDSVNHTPPPCERLCAGPSVVPQAERQQLDLLSGLWLAPAPVPSFEFHSFDTERLLPSEPIRWREPVPIAIAYLRLAL